MTAIIITLVFFFFLSIFFVHTWNMYKRWVVWWRRMLCVPNFNFVIRMRTGNKIHRKTFPLLNAITNYVHHLFHLLNCECKRYNWFALAVANAVKHCIGLLSFVGRVHGLIGHFSQLKHFRHVRFEVWFYISLAPKNNDDFFIPMLNKCFARNSFLLLKRLLIYALFALQICNIVGWSEILNKLDRIDH